MTETTATVRAGAAAGSKMPAERGSMGNNSGAIAGQSKIRSVNQSKPDGRKDSKDEKNFLQDAFRIIRSGFAAHDAMDDIPGGDSAGIFRFLELAVRADDFFGFLPFLPAGGKAMRA